MTRRTEGNAELIEAAWDKLQEVWDECDDDVEKVFETLDVPMDGDIALGFVPELRELIAITRALEIIVDDDDIAVGITAGFIAHLGAIQTRAFLVGYIAAKMEKGEL